MSPMETSGWGHSWSNFPVWTSTKNFGDSSLRLNQQNFIDFTNFSFFCVVVVTSLIFLGRAWQSTPHASPDLSKNSTFEEIQSHVNTNYDPNLHYPQDLSKTTFSFLAALPPEHSTVAREIEREQSCSCSSPPPLVTCGYMTQHDLRFSNNTTGYLVSTSS